MIKVTTNQRQFNRNLARAGSSMQETAAETVNKGVEIIQRSYKNNLKKNVKLKNKFSLGSTKTYKAKPFRSSGELRKMDDINAVVGVRKMKGGSEHYLAKMEEGGVQRGNPKTINRVPVPLDQSRIGGSENKPIAPINRINRSEPQILLAGGKKFGVPGDGIRTPGRRFAILHRYRREGGNLVGDIAKPFLFIGAKRGQGIFRWKSNRFHMMRSLTKKTVRVKANPQFEKSVDQLTPQKMDTLYRAIGKRKLAEAQRKMKG
jgi:hypothetical protein